MRIAVVGAGIAGLSAAWHLAADKMHSVTVFEREPRLGGHANTIDVAANDAPGGRAPIDSGFIVYNEASYPNLIALFDHLSVETSLTDMSLSVSLDGGGYEYSGSGFNGLFGQRRNLIRPAHYRMLADLLRFFRDATAMAEGRADHPPPTQSLSDWLGARRYSRAFIDRHMTPMAAAIWSTPSASILDFPAAAFLRFFANHGLLQVKNRPKWRTVTGGSRTYVTALTRATDAHFEVGAGVRSIARQGAGVWLTFSDGSAQMFDAVVIATHGDTAGELLSDADAAEREILGAYRTTANRTIMHRDPRAMPKRRRLWSSWNYVSPGDSDGLSVSYWMNRLQPLATAQDWFVTLNPTTLIRDDLIAFETTYTHPLFDTAAIDTQPKLWSLQGRRRTWFCGSYFGYGFHEDALQSGLAVAEDITGRRRPWRDPRENDRLHLPEGWSPETRGPFRGGDATTEPTSVAS